MARGLGAAARRPAADRDIARDSRLEHGAVVGDHADAAVCLPQRERLALGDRDLQPVGIKLQHRRVGDPRIGLQPRARIGRRRGTAATTVPVTPARARISSRVRCLLPVSAIEAMRKPTALAEPCRARRCSASATGSTWPPRDDAVADGRDNDEGRGRNAAAAVEPQPARRDGALRATQRSSLPIQAGARIATAARRARGAQRRRVCATPQPRTGSSGACPARFSG